MIQNWINNHDDQLITGIVFIDFKKAFDSVWHKGLILKLICYGIEGPLILLLSSYLHNRTHSLRYKSVLSSSLRIERGIPQGSVLGPLLFLLFINDINEIVCNGQVRLCADDLVFWCKSKSFQTVYSQMQDFADKLTTWSRKWCLEINTDKSSTMFINNKRKKLPNPFISLNGRHLNNQSSVKYFGIELNSNLTWNDQISAVLKKCSNHLAHVSNLRVLSECWSQILSIYCQACSRILSFTIW